MRADGCLLARRATLAAMSGVLLGMLLAALNQTIVATALPRIVGEPGGVDHYSWVFSAYMLGATVTTPIYGRLSDVYGRRPFFVAGDWRWVFFVSLRVGLVALAVIAATLKIPPHPERGTKVDYAGATLLAIGLSSGLLAIVRGGPFELYAVSALILAVFVWWERRIDQPVVPAELFASRVFTASNLAAFSVGVGMFGAIMFAPLYVQGVGASATASGIVLTPLLLAMMVTSVGSGQVITRTGRYRWALIAGPVIMGAGFVLLAGLNVSSPRIHATAAMVVTGLGLGLLIQNLSLVVQNGVSSRHLGAATSAAQFFRSIGGAIGGSVMGAILRRTVREVPA